MSVLLLPPMRSRTHNWASLGSQYHSTIDLTNLLKKTLDIAHSIYKEKLETLDVDIKKLIHALISFMTLLKTGTLNLNDLAPRIKEHKKRQDEITETRVQLETEMKLHSINHVDVEQVKSYAHDLESLLAETDITTSKAFLRSFIEKLSLIALREQYITDYRYPVIGKKKIR